MQVQLVENRQPNISDSFRRDASSDGLLGQLVTGSNQANIEDILGQTDITQEISVSSIKIDKSDAIVKQKVTFQQQEEECPHFYKQKNDFKKVFFIIIVIIVIMSFFLFVRQVSIEVDQPQNLALINQFIQFEDATIIDIQGKGCQNSNKSEYSMEQQIKVFDQVYNGGCLGFHFKVSIDSVQKLKIGEWEKKLVRKLLEVKKYMMNHPDMAPIIINIELDTCEKCQVVLDKLQQITSKVLGGYYIYKPKDLLRLESNLKEAVQEYSFPQLRYLHGKAIVVINTNKQMQKYINQNSNKIVFYNFFFDQLVEKDSKLDNKNVLFLRFDSNNELNWQEKQQMIQQLKDEKFYFIQAFDIKVEEDWVNYKQMKVNMLFTKKVFNTGWAYIREN